MQILKKVLDTDGVKKYAEISSTNRGSYVKKEVRISVNGTHQFTVTADQNEPNIRIADRAAKVMNIRPHSITVGKGSLDLVTR